MEKKDVGSSSLEEEVLNEKTAWEEEAGPQPQPSPTTQTALDKPLPTPTKDEEKELDDGLGTGMGKLSIGTGSKRQPPPPKLDLPPPPPPPKDPGYTSVPPSPHPLTPQSASATTPPVTGTHPPRTTSLLQPQNVLADTTKGGLSDTEGPSDGEDEKTSKEIHTILDQFHPPRKDSLPGTESASVPPPPPKIDLPPRIEISSPVSQIPPSPATPLPKPEPDLPFDFHRFLEQLKHRTADPVARFLRSFLNEFSKKQWMVHEQEKIIRDFLIFITGKMSLCEVWRDVSEQEFDNAKEGMEKLVMNRLYTQTFSPAIPPPPASPPPQPQGRRRRKEEEARFRKGQHQEDVERDEILSQKIAIYSWIREEHLDIPAVSETGKRFLNLARQELVKIGNYRAPRDKIICVLNCCKVIFGLLRQAKADESADRFLPHLIYVVLQANPKHLVSNVNYIVRFRNPDKLTGEAGYYLSTLMSVIHFIENLSPSSLTITPAEFEKNVESAVAAIAERAPVPPSPSTPNSASFPSGQPQTQTPQTNTPKPPSTPSQLEDPPHSAVSIASTASGAGPLSAGLGTLGGALDSPNMLFKSLQKPLSSIGRIFGDPGTPPPPSPPAPQPQQQIHQPAPSTPSGPVPIQAPRRTASPAQLPVGTPDARDSAVKSRFYEEEAAARQASREAEEARRLGRREEESVIGILQAMFPALEREIIADVVRIKEGRVGLAVDACLALSAGI